MKEEQKWWTWKHHDKAWKRVVLLPSANRYLKSKYLTYSVRTDPS